MDYVLFTGIVSLSIIILCWWYSLKDDIKYEKELVNYYQIENDRLRKLITKTTDENIHLRDKLEKIKNRLENIFDEEKEK